MFYRSKEKLKKSITRLLKKSYLLAHNGSGFDSYIVINNLPRWQSVVILIKNGAGVISLKMFNGYVDQNKKNPRCVQFRCVRVDIKSIVKK